VNLSTEGEQPLRKPGSLESGNTCEPDLFSGEDAGKRLRGGRRESGRLKAET
jgi:hypothetical protein